MVFRATEAKGEPRANASAISQDLVLVAVLDVWSPLVFTLERDTHVEAHHVKAAGDNKTYTRCRGDLPTLKQTREQRDRRESRVVQKS